MSKVFVAGERGFLGSALMRVIGDNAVGYNGHEYDFTRLRSAELAIERSGADSVVNAAGKVGGITANSSFPADFYIQNLIMGTNLMRAALDFGIKKYVQIGTVCSYPRDIGVYPARECDFWNGEPEATNGAYGQAKRALVIQAQSYSKQHGFNIINPILANLYGPGDHYDDARSHVIPALIKKFLNAVEENKSTVTLLGTGDCTREFLFVDDAATAINFLLRKYDSPEIINVASGNEVSIKQLANLIAELCKFRGDILWDTSRPDGQPRRNFDTSKMEKLGWKASTSLLGGLLITINDYQTRKKLLNVDYARTK